MRAFRFALAVALVILLAAPLAAGSHEARVKRAKDAFLARRAAVGKDLESIADSYLQYGLDTNNLQTIRKTLSELDRSNAWRDLASRETRTQNKADAVLNELFISVNQQLATARKEVEKIKKAEFYKWARQNPAAAKLLELERRIQQAEADASTAGWAAEQAQRDAESAQWKAQQADQQAQQAEWDAARANRRARRAERKADGW